MDEQITTGQVAKKWGLIYGLVGTVVVLAPLILETQVSWILAVQIAIAILFFALGTREFKINNGGFMTFGEGFKITMITAMIGGVIRNVVNYAYVKVVDPDVNERMQEAMQNAWRDQGMTEQEIEQMSGFMSGISNPEIGLVLGIIFVLLGGLIWGSIVSAIVKNEAEDF